MKKTILKTFYIFFSTLLFFSFQFADSSEIRVFIKCQSELTFNELKTNYKIKILESKTGALQAFINNEPSDSVHVRDFSIRDNLNYPPNPQANYSDYNLGERALVAIYKQIHGFEDRGKQILISTDISFKLTEVKKLRIYDIWSEEEDIYTDAFGGQVLMEAYDKDGMFLGRIFRSFISNGCF